MLPQATIALYLQYGQISQYLAAGDTRTQNAFFGGNLNSNLSRLIYIVRKSVQFAYTYYPNTEQETVTALYLYAICGKYISKAQQIIGNAGGIIVNPATGLVSTIKAINYEFVIGTAGSPIDAGDTELTIPYTYIQNGSINIYLGGNLITPNQDGSETFTYTIAYSNDSAIVTFSEGVLNGQVYQITGQYFSTI